jgi:serine/threonine-protein kinase HipA
MTLVSKKNILNVWMNGQLVGVWQSGSQGHSFTYSESWLLSSFSRPISLSMPLRASPYKGDLVKYHFENLLPDSEQILRRIRDKYGANSTDPFDLLSEVGRDCVGAIQLLPQDQSPYEVESIKGVALDDEGVSRLLASTASASRLDGAEDEFRISIAGAQEKTALLKHNGIWMKPLGATPTTHIFKLPIGQVGALGIDLSTSVENEWLCERILDAYGIKTSKSEIAQFSDIKVLVVERFDRRLTTDGRWIMRLPQEDFCQVTGTPPGRKYEDKGGPGIQVIMDRLLGSNHADADRLMFFKTQIIFWMLCAIDGHAKNFSVFIEGGGGYHLTPVYDVISAYPVIGHGSNKVASQKIKMAMAFCGKNRHYHWDKITYRHIISTAKQVGIAECEHVMQLLVEMTPEVIKSVINQMPADFPVAVSEPILEGLSIAARKLVTDSK